MAFGNAIGPSGNAAGYALTADLSAYNAFLYSGSAPVAMRLLASTGQVPWWAFPRTAPGRCWRFNIRAAP
jgi:hypothetical protein